MCCATEFSGLGNQPTRALRGSSSSSSSEALSLPWPVTSDEECGELALEGVKEGSLPVEDASVARDAGMSVDQQSARKGKPTHGTASAKRLRRTLLGRSHAGKCNKEVVDAEERREDRTLLTGDVHLLRGAHRP